MRILVCGSRTWDNKEAIETRMYDQLTAAQKGYRDVRTGVPELVFIHGAASGADELCQEVVEDMHDDGHLWVAVQEFPAEWNKYGRAAGPIRNKQMLVEGRPEIVLAFWDGKSRGTANMISQAKAAGVPVEIIR